MWLFLFLSFFFQPTHQPLSTRFRPKCIRCCRETPGHATPASPAFRPAPHFRLVRLPAGRTAYTDEESRKNFEAVTRFVLPGVPLRAAADDAAEP